MHSRKIRIENIGCLVGLICIGLILTAALYFQFVWGESPCPLCLLQRASFIGVALSLLMNLRYGQRVLHWGLAILMSCVGAAVSIRQILLNILNPKGFASPILGLHMYTWCLVGFVSSIVGCAVILMFYPDRS